MAIGLIKGIIGAVAGAGKAYNTYKEIEEKKNKSSSSSSSSSSKSVPTTPKYNEHQQYIQDTFAGGYDDYKRIQQSRYDTAYKTGDYDLMSNLDQDAKRVGYNLIVPQIQQQQSQQPQQGGQLNISNPYDSYMDEIEDRYAAINSQIANSNKAAVQQGVNRLQNQIPVLNQGFDDAARQAYISNMQSRRVLPQQLAVQGASGGVTETANLGLETSYQNNLNNINTQRQNSLSEINNSMTDLKNSGDLATAEQILQNNQSALKAYQDMINNSASYNQWMANFNENKDNNQWNKDYQVGRDNVNDLRYDNSNADSLKQQEYNNILNRLSMGLITPNDAVALGVSSQDVQSFVDRIIAAQNAELANTNSLINKRQNGGTGNNESNENPVLTTADKYLGQGNRAKAIEALASIYTNKQIKEYLVSKGYRIDDIDWEDDNPISLPNSLQPERLPGSPLSVQNIVAFLSSQGLSNEEIAERLNRNQ